MVEHQLPKLTVRVRFPSSALIQKARSEAVSEAWPFVVPRPGVVVLGETVTALILGGVALVLVGVALTRARATADH
jgi:hypothetical protein